MIDLTPTLMQKYKPYGKKPGRYSVSDIWAILNGYKTYDQFLFGETIYPEAAIKMWQGSWKHEQIQELTKQLGYESEIKIEYKPKEFPELTVVGKVDCMDKTHILEIKTSSEILEKAKPWQEHQARMYCTMFARDHAYVVQPVINSGKVILKQIGMVDRNDKWVESQLEKLLEWHKEVKKYAVSKIR